jgi:hypothetical protein
MLLSIRTSCSNPEMDIRTCPGLKAPDQVSTPSILASIKTPIRLYSVKLHLQNRMNRKIPRNLNVKEYRHHDGPRQGISSSRPTKKLFCCTEGLGLAVGGACLLLLLLGSSPHVHACHPRGALHAHWVCRVFSGPWD